MKLNIRLLMTGLLVQLAVTLVAQNRLFVISDPHVIRLLPRNRRQV